METARRRRLNASGGSPELTTVRLTKTRAEIRW
jgi:hypothetical protein